MLGVTDGEHNILEFRQLPELDHGANWLWKFQGQVKVIATEYRDGVHYSTKPHHFLPIVDHLKQLHANHYVHGDIRAFNMVLQYTDHEENTIGENLAIGTDNSQSSSNEVEKCKGWLIDFDYGGMLISDTEILDQSTTGNNLKLNPKYPGGYVRTLSDGRRLGKAGIDIKFADDWFALGTIIFHFHHIPSADKKKIEDIQMRDTLSRIENEFLDDNFASSDYDFPGAANALREYLKLAAKQGFTLKPTVDFQMYLDDEKMLERQTRQMRSSCATGSPPPKE